MDKVVCWAIYYLEKQHRGERAQYSLGELESFNGMKAYCFSGTVQGPGEPRIKAVVSLGKGRSQVDTAGDFP